MKSLFEQTGGTYRHEGKYLIPNIALHNEENPPIGIWGQRHLKYLKQHCKVLYYNLLTSGILNGYIAEVNKQAEDMFYRLVQQLAESEGVTEQLKAKNAFEWARRMNNIRACAMEIVNKEIIFA